MSFRVSEPPVGGNRIAWSYLAAVVGLVIGGLFWAVWTQAGGIACPPADDLCAVGWTVSGGLLGLTLGLGAAAFFFRLGWEWWLVIAALLLGSPLWANALPPWTLAVIGVLLPALAAVATWTGPRRPVWRPWVIGAVALVLLVGAAVVLLAPGA